MRTLEYYMQWLLYCFLCLTHVVRLLTATRYGPQATHCGDPLVTVDRCIIATTSPFYSPRSYAVDETKLFSQC